MVGSIFLALVNSRIRSSPAGEFVRVGGYTWTAALCSVVDVAALTFYRVFELLMLLFVLQTIVL